MSSKKPSYYIKLDGKLSNSLQTIAASKMDLRQIKNEIDKMRMKLNPQKKLYRQLHKTIQQSASTIVTNLEIEHQEKTLDPEGKIANPAWIEKLLGIRILKSVDKDPLFRLVDLSVAEIEDGLDNLQLIIPACEKALREK